MRSMLRVWCIVLATAVAFAVVAPDLALPWQPWSTLGFFTVNGAVVAVDAQAARSGLRVGDVVNVERLDTQGRARLFTLQSFAPVGAVLTVPLNSGRSVTLTAHPYPRSLAANVTDVIEVIGLLLYLFIAATLVLLRPMPSTWAFYLFSYVFILSGTGTLFFSTVPPGIEISLKVVIDLMLSVTAIAFVVFALRFPNVTLDGQARQLERILLVAVAPLLAATVLAVDFGYIFWGQRLPQGISVAFQITTRALFATGVLILLYRYAKADDEMRTRLQWVVAAFSVAFVPFFSLDVIGSAFNLVGNVVIGNIASTVSVIAPIALAYTILRHRLFDIRLVLSRALIFGVLTTVAVGTLALADWGFGIWLAQSKFALASEAALALALGFSMTHLHRKIEGALNAIIFREQSAALATLRRYTHELDLIADPQRLLGQTYESLVEHMDIEFAAIYAAEGSSFVRACGGDPAPDLLPSDDFAVLRLRRWSEPFECDGAHHPLRGALLLPMSARTELVGFIACGPKHDRTHYLPKEVEALAALAHRAGSAYAWLTLRPALGVPTHNAAALRPI